MVAVVWMLAAAAMSMDEAVVQASQGVVADEAVAAATLEAASRFALPLEPLRLRVQHRRLQHLWGAPQPNGLPSTPLDDVSLSLALRPPQLGDIVGAITGLDAAEQMVDAAMIAVAVDARARFVVAAAATKRSELMARRGSLMRDRAELVSARVAAGTMTAAELERGRRSKANAAAASSQSRREMAERQTELALLTGQLATDYDDSWQTRCRQGPVELAEQVGTRPEEVEFDLAKRSALAARLQLVPWLREIDVGAIYRDPVAPLDWRVSLDFSLPAFSWWSREQQQAGARVTVAEASLRTAQSQDALLRTSHRALWLDANALVNELTLLTAESTAAGDAAVGDALDQVDVSIERMQTQIELLDATEACALISVR